jgi:hypothetical protein
MPLSPLTTSKHEPPTGKNIVAKQRRGNDLRLLVRANKKSHAANYRYIVPPNRLPGTATRVGNRASAAHVPLKYRSTIAKV